MTLKDPLSRIPHRAGSPKGILETAQTHGRRYSGQMRLKLNILAIKDSTMSGISHHPDNTTPTVIKSYTHSGFLFSCLISYILLLCCVNRVRLWNPCMVSAQTSVYPTPNSISSPPNWLHHLQLHLHLWVIIQFQSQPPSPPIREPLYPLRSSTYSGDLGTCDCVLLQCSVVLEQQSCSYPTSSSYWGEIFVWWWLQIF